MLAAAEIFSRLAMKKPEPHEAYFAQCCHILGVSYTKLEMFEEAEEQFKKALEIQLRLASANPVFYDHRAAETYVAYGKSLFFAKQYADALNNYESAFRLCKKLAERDPGAFEPLLADTHANLGELFAELERFQESEDSFNTAIKLYEKYSEANPGCADKADDARESRDAIKAKKLQASGSYIELTAVEKEVASLLMEGLPQRDIARKLNMNISDYRDFEQVIRQKLNPADIADPVIVEAAERYRLTKRERLILTYLIENTTTEKIAAELYVSEETVRGHIRTLLKKLGVKKRQGVAVWFEEYRTGKIE